jgi:hypothetical protein
MALFQKSNPEKAAEKRATDARAARDKLASRLAQAQGVVAETHKTLQRLVVESADDAALARGEALLHEAERRVATLLPVLSEIENSIPAFDREIADLAEKNLRAATAAETNAIADELIQAAAGFDIAVGILSDASARAALISFEGTGLASFSVSARVEVPAAVEIVSALLREHGRAVLRGDRAATLPTPEAPFVPTIPAKPVNDAPPHEPPIQFERVHRPSYQFRVAGGTS